MAGFEPVSSTGTANGGSASTATSSGAWPSSEPAVVTPPGAWPVAERTAQLADYSAAQPRTGANRTQRRSHISTRGSSSPFTPCQGASQAVPPSGAHHLQGPCRPGARPSAHVASAKDLSSCLANCLVHNKDNCLAALVWRCESLGFRNGPSLDRRPRCTPSDGLCSALGGAAPAAGPAAGPGAPVRVQGERGRPPAGLCWLDRPGSRHPDPGGGQAGDRLRRCHPQQFMPAGAVGGGLCWVQDAAVRSTAMMRSPAGSREPEPRCPRRPGSRPNPAAVPVADPASQHHGRREEAPARSVLGLPAASLADIHSMPRGCWLRHVAVTAAHQDLRARAWCRLQDQRTIRRCKRWSRC